MFESNLRFLLKFVPEFRIDIIPALVEVINNSPALVEIVNNIPALVEIMAWHLPGDKPLSKPMMVSLLMQYVSLCFNELIGHVKWKMEHMSIL